MPLIGATMGTFSRWRSGQPGPDALLLAAVWLLAELTYRCPLRCAGLRVSR